MENRRILFKNGIGQGLPENNNPLRSGFAEGVVVFGHPPPYGIPEK